jgi:hypothetical protein
LLKFCSRLNSENFTQNGQRELKEFRTAGAEQAEDVGAAVNRAQSIQALKG